jgi:hypothetical protein
MAINTSLTIHGMQHAGPLPQRPPLVAFLVPTRRTRTRHHWRGHGPGWRLRTKRLVGGVCTHHTTCVMVSQLSHNSVVQAPVCLGTHERGHGQQLHVHHPLPDTSMLGWKPHLQTLHTPSVVAARWQTNRLLASPQNLCTRLLGASPPVHKRCTHACRCNRLQVVSCPCPSRAGGLRCGPVSQARLTPSTLALTAFDGGHRKR